MPNAPLPGARREGEKGGLGDPLERPIALTKKMPDVLRVRVILLLTIRSPSLGNQRFLGPFSTMLNAPLPAARGEEEKGVPGYF